MRVDLLRFVQLFILHVIAFIKLVLTFRLHLALQSLLSHHRPKFFFSFSLTGLCGL